MRVEPADSTVLARRRCVAVAIVLTALNLRIATSSSGPLLAEIGSGLAMSTATAGLLTGLPMICFAAAGLLATGAARRLGAETALLAGLVIVFAGTLGRGLVGSAEAFLVSSVMAFAGLAMGNVLLPVVVRTHFPDRVGAMTAAYTTVLAAGASASAALSVPLASWAAHQGVTSDAEAWRFSVAVWALPAAAGTAAWLVWRPHARRVPQPAFAAWPATRDRRARVPRALAWALAGYFGAQSLLAFVAMGWFAQFFREAGASATKAGSLLAFVSALSVPISLAVPILAARMRSPKPLIIIFASAYAGAYVGMLAAPISGAWLWALLLGIGSGTFPLSLTLFSLTTASPDETAALSRFAQSTGYACAAMGPLAVGWLHEPGEWGPSFAVLFGALAVQLACGLRAARTTIGASAAAPAGSRRGPEVARSLLGERSQVSRTQCAGQPC